MSKLVNENTIINKKDRKINSVVIWGSSMILLVMIVSIISSTVCITSGSDPVEYALKIIMIPTIISVFIMFFITLIAICYVKDTTLHDENYVEETALDSSVATQNRESNESYTRSDIVASHAP